jgi:hypothetical protein
MAQTNREFSEQDTIFKNCCLKVWGADLKRPHKHLPLTRQASKFRRGKGLVYQTLIGKK